MHHTTRDVLGQAAYLRRSCELLLDQLRDIDRSATGREELTPIQEAAVVDATKAHADRAKDHLDLASQFVTGWQRDLDRALAMEPSWQRP